MMFLPGAALGRPPVPLVTAGTSSVPTGQRAEAGPRATLRLARDAGQA
jgi:hypothetical protein